MSAPTRASTHEHAHPCRFADVRDGIFRFPESERRHLWAVTSNWGKCRTHSLGFLASLGSVAAEAAPPSENPRVVPTRVYRSGATFTRAVALPVIRSPPPMPPKSRSSFERLAGEA